jgi:hypothetical protein
MRRKPRPRAKAKAKPGRAGRAFYLGSFGLLLLGGLAWIFSRYALEGHEGLGEWALESQFWALKLHGAGAFLFLVALGYSLAENRRKLELALLGLAILSGWLIYYGPSGDLRDHVSMAHWILGLLSAVALAWGLA